MFPALGFDASCALSSTEHIALLHDLVFPLIKSSFQLGVESSLAIALAKNISRHFLDQSEAKAKATVTCSHAFTRAWCRIYVFTLSYNCNCFTGLHAPAFVLIVGQRYFGFGSTTLK